MHHLLTCSSLRLYRTCPRAYLHRYEQGLVPRAGKSDALAFGTLIHAALEAYWRGGHDATSALLVIDEQAEGEWRAQARAMVLAYASRWADDHLEALAVEVEFRAPMIDVRTGKRLRGISRAGKIDAIARDARGDVWIVEHKTTTQDIGRGSPYFERLTLDLQVSHYMLGARALGYDPVGVVYDVLRKPKSKRALATPEAERRYTAEGKLYARQRDTDESLEDYSARLVDELQAAPDDYLQRAELHRLGHELVETQLDDLASLEAMRRDRKRGHWPRNDGACVRYGSRCEYWGICSGAIGPDELPDHYAQRRAHEELGPNPDHRSSAQRQRETLQIGTSTESSQ